jgi:hypothetical protein
MSGYRIASLVVTNAAPLVHTSGASESVSCKATVANLSPDGLVMFDLIVAANAASIQPSEVMGVPIVVDAQSQIEITGIVYGQGQSLIVRPYTSNAQLTVNTMGYKE